MNGRDLTFGVVGVLAVAGALASRRGSRSEGSYRSFTHGELTALPSGTVLEGEDGRGLETEVVLELSSDLTDESLEGELSDEELGGLLETSDLAKSDGSWSEAVGLLDTSGSGGLLGSLLVGDVLAGGLSSGVLAGGVLGACHGNYFNFLDRCRIK